MKQLSLLTCNVLPGKGHVAVFVFVFFAQKIETIVVKQKWIMLSRICSVKLKI